MSDDKAVASTHHPNGLAVLWAVIAYPIAALLWAVAAAIIVTSNNATSFGEAFDWFGWGTVSTSVVSVAFAVLAVPILMAELLVWRQIVARFPYFERDRMTVAQACALLALPWMVFNPLPWGTAITFGAAFLGLVIARLSIPRLAPGSLRP
ncbi:hypothetical protein HQ535_07130 [bacterium]|nr:hypothetical protein [bacterium]